MKTFRKWFDAFLLGAMAVCAITGITLPLVYDFRTYFPFALLGVACGLIGGNTDITYYNDGGRVLRLKFWRWTWTLIDKRKTL